MSPARATLPRRKANACFVVPLLVGAHFLFPVCTQGFISGFALIPPWALQECRAYGTHNAPVFLYEGPAKYDQKTVLALGFSVIESYHSLRKHIVPPPCKIKHKNTTSTEIFIPSQYIIYMWVYITCCNPRPSATLRSS